mgnify:CR=1 FL=1|jgi:hypothetical protein
MNDEEPLYFARCPYCGHTSGLVTVIESYQSSFWCTRCNRSFKIEPRLKCLRKIYKDLLNEIRTADFIKDCNGVRNYCKLNNMSEEDVAELLDELESQGRI